MVDNTCGENKKCIGFRVKCLQDNTYWGKIFNTQDIKKAVVFSWEDLTEWEKLSLKTLRKLYRIIPVYKEI